MSKNAQLRKSIVAVMLAVLMVVSVFAAAIGSGADVKAATIKTVNVIYTGTEAVDLYLDGYQANSYVDTWELVSANSNFTCSETKDANGYTVFAVSFDFGSIYSVDFKTNIGAWNWLGFSWDEINNGATTKYVYADGSIGTEAPAGDEEEEEPETPAGPTSTGTATFVYVGTADGVTADNFWFYMDWAEGSLATTSSGNDLGAFSITKASTTIDGYSAVVLTGSNVASELSNMWLKFGYDTQIGETLALAFDNSVYYVTDDSYSTTPPEEEEEPVVTNNYTVNVYVYGQSAEVGGWLIYSEGGSEKDWGTSKTGTGSLSGDWAKVTLSFSTTKTFNGVGVQLIEGGTWLSPQYKLNFSGNTCNMWIVPEAGSCYDNEADALAAAAEPATSSTIIFHYKKTSGTMGGWVVGTWYTSAINGNWGSKDTVFTYEDDWGYVAVVKYSAVVNEIGFKFHRRAKIDGVANDWYKEDGTADRTVKLNNGFAEVWVTQGKKAVSYTCPSGASEFDKATATPFKNYRYLLVNTEKGEDADLVFHYLRKDGNYDNWTVGIWAEVTAGTWKDAQIEQNADLDEYGAATYTVNLADWPKTQIGFGVNYNNWEKKDYAADRYVDVSGVEAGEILNVYLYEGDGTIYYAPKTDALVEEESAGVDADVVFHYSRTNSDYEGWMVGLWCELADGSWLNDNVAFNGTDANGFATVTVDLSAYQAETLGFKLNKDNWAEEDGGDRSLDLADIKDGDIIDVYLYEGDICVYFEPIAAETEEEVEEPVEEVVSETDAVEEAPAPVEEETKGGCAGCTGCSGCATMLPVFAVIIAAALVIFKKRV